MPKDAAAANSGKTPSGKTPSSKTPENGNLGEDDPSDSAMLGEIESEMLAESSDDAVDPVAKAFAMNARMLQVVHQSHERLAKALERGDRAEMVVQSTDALNRTFRRLHEAQDQLATRLEEERRQKPLMVLLSVLVAGSAIVFLLYFLVDALTLDLRDEVERFASAREEQEASATESQEQFASAGMQLLEAVDRGLATNRVLSNENQAGLEALRTERERSVALEDQLKAMEAERARTRADADRFRQENLDLAQEVDGLRNKLIEQEMSGGGLQAAIESVMDGGPVSPDPSGGKPGVTNSKSAEAPENPSSLTAPGMGMLDEKEDPSSSQFPPAAAAPDSDVAANAAVDARAITMAMAAAAKSSPPSATPFQPDDKNATGAGAAAPPASPEVETLNKLLQDAGIIGLRILKAGAVTGNFLGEAFVEVREHGFPIGVHNVARLHLEVDPVRRSGVLVLEDGVSILRGQRTSIIPGSPLRIELPALAEGSWLDPTLLDVVRLVPSEMPIEGAGVDSGPEEPSYDPRSAIAVLDRLLSSDGYQEYEFADLGGVIDRDGVVVLKSPQLHVYSVAGILRRTVEAAECVVDVDPAARVVTLRFVDGHHKTGGRDVAFFKGLGDEVGTWTVRLTRADPIRWTEACSRLIQNAEE